MPQCFDSRYAGEAAPDDHDMRSFGFVCRSRNDQ
jgi:hypothetical protein